MESTAKKLVKSHGNVKYSDADRRNAVALYLTHGVMAIVSRETGISESTLSTWKEHEPWWQEYSEKLRNEITDRVRSDIDRVVALAYRETEDRLNHGEYKVVGKSLKRVPLSGRDVAWIAAVMTDKRQVLGHQPTSITTNVLDGRLANLLDKFGDAGDSMKRARGITIDNDPGAAPVDNELQLLKD